LTDARARTPKPVPHRRDLRGVALSPTDGFVLSRIDGSVDERELVALTGLPDDQVRASLEKLESFGLVTFDGVRPRSPTPSAALPTGSASGVRPLAPPVNAASSEPMPPPRRAPETHADVALTPEEQALLSEEADLDDETRRQVLITHRALETLDHYALLRVDRSADRKALKRAYYDLAAKFHPDRYFRKKLGSFKVRMEAIFGRITLAHDTLTDKDKRAEYDAYLEEQHRSRGIEELLEEALAEAKRAEERIEREAREQVAAAAATPPAPVKPTPVIPGPAVQAAARRDALARRLLGGRTPHTPSTPPATGQVAMRAPLPSTVDAMDALRRRYDERVTHAKNAQARKYIANGEAALAAGDAVAAANAFRVAKALSPNAPELERAANEAQQRADAILSETYAKQAGYEEKNGQWAEAARSWLRVTKARPQDSLAYERAANAIVKAGGDLHEAGRVAKHACTLEPQAASFRLTLANVFLAAGLTLNARRELETAAQLAPHDGTIQAMLRRVGKS
jgi:curved DNA-binding protein CbpA